MATSVSYNKAPPLLSQSKNYEDWKKLIGIWTELTTLDKKKQGPSLVLTLDGKSQEAALELSREQISSENGVQNIINRLDKIYAKDKLTEKFDAIEKFETYRRTKEKKIRDFLTEFDKRYYKIKNYINYPDDLLAYRLLKAANLDNSHERLIKATITDLVYEDVRQKLIKVFAEESIEGDLESSMSSVKIKSEPAFYTNEAHPDDYQPTSSDEEGVYYVKRNYNQRFSSSKFNKKGNNWRQEKPAVRTKADYSRKPGKNPLDKNGRVSRCVICESVYHWQQDCPEKQNDTYMVHEIVLHNESNKPGQLKHLVSETWNCGLLDCGASKTVCGDVWLEQYVNSLSDEEKREVKHHHSKSLYRFGDGEQVQACGRVSIPAIIGNTKVKINTDVIPKDLPLLLSKSFMKRADMILDFQNDSANALGETVHLATTSSGHYTIPLTKPRQIIASIDKPFECNFVFISKEDKNMSSIAEKLHRQFAHPSLNQILSLINKAGAPWSNSKELISEIKRVDKECTTCQIYRRSPPRPVVGLPMASKFLETVAMDLKFYDKKIILHLIDMCTRLSAATTIKDKNPTTVIEAILKTWISVYGSCEKFLVDNGGEFANEELINLAEQFGITIKTTAAESPWSNGIVERHNQTLSNMLDKVLNDTKCSINTALYWCVNAKNSLHNAHGFTPYQLSIGTNPQLPSLIDDKPPALSGKPATQMMKENLEVLHKAREAFIASEHSERIRRALAHNIRTSGEIKYLTGDRRRKRKRETTSTTEERLPRLNIPNVSHQSSEESESDVEDSLTPINNDPPTTPTQQLQTQSTSVETHNPPQKEQLKLKPNLCLKYKDNDGEWQKARILSRVGKVGGKHEGWFNVETETGMKRSINFAKIKDIEINESPEEVTLIANNDEIIRAKSKELQSWIDNSVYTEAPDQGQKSISLRWVVTPKLIDGQPSVKARLVARGFEEIQNFKTDSPTCSKEGLRLALTIIASNNWTLNSLDVKTAFLQGKEIDREVFVQPPKEANTKYLWRLSKTVYGLADASRSWYLKLRSELIKLGGKPIDLDQGIFIWSSNASLIGISVCFVDDVIWAGSTTFTNTISKLKGIFRTSSEHVQHFKYIGINLNQHEDGTITISQNDYVTDLRQAICHQEQEQPQYLISNLLTRR
ncbi:uncharacterized protein [Clytia hemisphaerica]|uniref:uncharacterized protein n=1 Tax=Clytia hemisphaerica TaxID=252671 RepID=UPI0034D75388